jgi:hypothetical protein
MLRAALFTLVGVGFFAHWVITDPSFEGSPTQDEWPYVLWFSGVILSLAIALPVFAGLAGSRPVFRASLIAS